MFNPGASAELIMASSIEEPTVSQTKPRPIAGWRRARVAAVIFGLGVPVLYSVICVMAALILLSAPRTLSNQTPADSGLQFEGASFPSRAGAIPIAAWFIPGSSARAVVLVHGKGASRTKEFQGQFLKFAEDLHGRGFNVLDIDLRGHGASGRAFITFGIDEKGDIEAAVDWLKARGFNPSNIGVLGVSLGGASSIMAAADDPDIAAVVADSSYADIYPVIEGAWRRTSGLPEIFLYGSRLAAHAIVGFDVTTAKPVQVISRISPRPVLLIHGAGDTLIPMSQAQQLKQADTQAVLWQVPGVGHAGAYSANPKQYVDTVTAFFDSKLGN